MLAEEALLFIIVFLIQIDLNFIDINILFINKFTLFVFIDVLPLFDFYLFLLYIELQKLT